MLRETTHLVLVESLEPDFVPQDGEELVEILQKAPHTPELPRRQKLKTSKNRREEEIRQRGQSDVESRNRGSIILEKNQFCVSFSEYKRPDPRAKNIPFSGQ